MEKIKEFLLQIGFRANEAEVYAALVEHGTSSVLELAKLTKVHRSNIYDSLRILVERGLVYTINNPTRQFSARDPRSLTGYLKRKELELDELLKHYVIHTSKRKEGPLVRVSEGPFALREAITSLLIPRKPICVFGIPGRAPEVIGPMLHHLHKERISLKVPMLHIYNASAIDRVHYLNKMKHTEARILPSKYDSSTTTCVAGDKVAIFLWGEKITVIEMENEDVAKTYANYFDILWRKAKVV